METPKSCTPMQRRRISWLVPSVQRKDTVSLARCGVIMTGAVTEWTTPSKAVQNSLLPVARPEVCGVQVPTQNKFPRLVCKSTRFANCLMPSLQTKRPTAAVMSSPLIALSIYFIQSDESVYRTSLYIGPLCISDLPVYRTSLYIGILS